VSARKIKTKLTDTFEIPNFKFLNKNTRVGGE
jgi:hypothetical protein